MTLLLTKLRSALPNGTDNGTGIAESIKKDGGLYQCGISYL